MKFGINTFVWVSPLTTASVLELAPKIKSLGFDLIELAVEGTDELDLAQINQVVHDNSLDVIVCGAFGPDRNLCSKDPTIRMNAKTYIRWLIDAAEMLGSPTVAGPMYSAVGKDHLMDENERAQEWQMAVAGVREMADYAQKKGIRLALETLNRFETDLLNTVDQGLQFIDDTGMQNVGLHLDTFHMHLEEKSSAAAIRKAGDKIFHFHACENDRGVPGSGQVHWASISDALKAIHYAGPVVIESFTPEVKEIARAVCIWREIAPSQDEIAKEGLKFLKSILVD